MGGKTKAQRTKNNAKPSSSGRSAELLGSAGPSFVGFSAHPDLGKTPHALAFCTTENLSETFDSGVMPQFQLVIRKMSKKDPVTKVKAIQEFTELISNSELDVVKNILPFWPKLYFSLASDVDHRVREASQEVQSLIVSKCKKLVAPYLKQLAPTWIASQYDNYAPASSISKSSFHTAFPGEKSREVCLFCQNEIMDLVINNVTYHTPATLNSSNSCTSDEAEQKYQRIISNSLKTLSFFLAKTSGADLSLVNDRFENLLIHPKLWSFAKHKSSSIRAAWFELMTNILRSSPNKTFPIKTQLISICFQNLDETDLLIIPHVWDCVLLLQSVFSDWLTELNFQKHIQSKISPILRSCCKGNAKAICPNLLPFISKISEKILENGDLEKFYEYFLDNIKTTITTNNQSIAKADYSALITAYFECLTFIFEKFNSKKEESTIIPSGFLYKYVVETVKWSLTTENFVYKYIFLHLSALLSHLAKNTGSNLYTFLLKEFWCNVIRIIEEDINQNQVTEAYISRGVLFINTIYFANENLPNLKVKFSGIEKENHDIPYEKQNDNSYETQQRNTSNQHNDLKGLAIILTRFCIEKSKQNHSITFLSQIAELTKLFPDITFYAKISSKNDVTDTLKILVFFIENDSYEPMELILDIIFNILAFLENQNEMDFINNHLLTIKRPIVQQWIIQRLMSHPMCTRPEVRVMLSQKHVIEIILKIAKDAVEGNSREHFNLLHKCFFQNELGEILINHEVVDGIVQILSKSLFDTEMKDMIDSCGSFLAQIMPVICSKNSAVTTQIEAFIKLFEFTIENSESIYLSKDTLLEMTTCWQDILSSKDIIIDSFIISKCAQIIINRIKYLDKHSMVTFDEIQKIASLVSKLVICSAENIENEQERNTKIIFLIDALLKINEPEVVGYVMQHVFDFCSFLEGLKGLVSITSPSPNGLLDICTKNFDINFLVAWNLLRVTTIINLLCRTEKKLAHLENMNADFELYEEKHFPIQMWPNQLYELIQEIINISSMCNSLVDNNINVNSSDILILHLSEKVKDLFRHGNRESIAKLEDFMLTNASQNDNTSCRSLLYLTCRYEQFEENAIILLAENLIIYFVKEESLSGYINTLQYITPKLPARTITLQSSVVQDVSNNVWSNAAFLRCIIKNNFNETLSEMSNKSIITRTLQFIIDISEKQRENNILLYNVEICEKNFFEIRNVVEYIYLLIDVISKVSHILTTKHWDAVRLGLSSWVLTVSKSVNNSKKPKVSIFIAAVFKLFASVVESFAVEKEKSSTVLHNAIIEEWEQLFARDINLVLFKSFYALVGQASECIGEYSTCYSTLIKEIAPGMKLLNYSVIFNFCRNSSQISLDDLINFLLKNISTPVHPIRTSCVNMLKLLAPFYIEADIEINKKNELIGMNNVNNDAKISDCYFISKFKDYIALYEKPIVKYVEEFSFKLAELPHLNNINRDEALSYLFLWDCITFVCSEAPAELRSLYTMWLTENKFEQNLLQFLFRAMPIEILKNHDSKVLNSDIFKGLSWTQIKDDKLAVEKYACHMYTEVLRKLPAIVRKWWNGSNSRQKTFVDKLTTNFVSSIICQEELRSISMKKGKHENMLVTVHTSTREVLAVYLIDEVRMELVITLANNYPLGAVKVESGKQIGGRASSRNIGMQLTIFLTHQNGSIFDGLTLWKKNLDKKFEGVEECYVCYTVIHQDTCQLPKLTCKTCKKKFHGPCLYKWFTTSSKSTCPICRNMF